MKHNTTVRLLRKALGLNKRDFAALVNYSTDTIHSLELERMNLSTRAATKIAQATGVSAYWLLRGCTSYPIENDRNRRWDLDYFRERQAEPFKPVSHEARFQEMAPSFESDVKGLLGIYAAALQSDKLHLLRYDFHRFRQEMAEVYGDNGTAMELVGLMKSSQEGELAKTGRGDRLVKTSLQRRLSRTQAE
jgi:transcriptional regulator with XRE-family HTH domain